MAPVTIWDPVAEAFETCIATVDGKVENCCPGNHGDCNEIKLSKC